MGAIGEAMIINNESGLILIGQSKTSRTDNLENYFSGKTSELLVISFDTPLIRGGRIRFTEWINGQVQSEKILFVPNLFQNFGSFLVVFSFLFYAFHILTFLIRQKKKYDVAIGVANFSAFCLMLSRFAKSHFSTLIYYSLDLYPRPHQSLAGKIVHIIYNFSERRLINHSDIIWDISKNMKKGRQRLLSIAPESYQVVVVPLGFPASYNIERPLSERQDNTIGFIGTISSNQGLELAVESISEVSKKIPDICLHLIGNGHHFMEIQKLIEQKKLEKNVIMHGFLDDKEAFDILRKCKFALALWTGDDHDTSIYADPGKPKLYALLGLPVIITQYTLLSETIRECNSGIIVPYKKEDVTTSIHLLLEDNKLYLEKYSGVQKFKKYCLIEPILKNALAETSSKLNTEIN